MAVGKAGLVAAAVAVLSLAAAGANAPLDQLIVPLSSPGRLGMLIVNHGRGSISVSGYDGETVVIRAALSVPAEPGGEDAWARGMKRISAGETRLSTEESGNTVTVFSNSSAKTIDLEILVPRHFNLKLSVKDNGAIRVSGVAGDMEINNLNGPVELDRLAGSALVNTVDGNLVCRFERVVPGLPLSFTSVYGKIDVTFPAGADLTVRMKTDQGAIFSDFDIATEDRKSLSEPSEKAGGRRITLEDWTTGKIGRGGTDVLLKSFEGNIYIRKGQAGRP